MAASQVLSLVIGLGQVESQCRQLIWPRPRLEPGMEWNCKFHNCIRRKMKTESKWAADTYSILTYECHEP